MTREELQKLPLSLIKENHRVALQWCTGLGKSRAAIEMANYLICKKLKESPESFHILLIVAETSHKGNWMVEFEKWKLKQSLVTIECYASLNKYRFTSWDLIVFDEAHHLGTDLKLDILFELQVKNVILLSATLPDQTMQAVSQRFGEFKTSKVSLKQAIEWGILPKPKVYLIPMVLDNTYSNCTITEEWGKKEKRVLYKCGFNERWKYLNNKKKYPDVTLIISCTQKQKYDYLSEQFVYWKRQFFKSRQDYVKNKWLQIGAKRKRFLGECKGESVRLLLYKLQNMRYICFCTSIEQAELLGGRNAIHSERKDSLDVIESFNRKRIDNLFAVGMLQEGQNLKDIQAGIIIQLDGQERTFIQKFGRSMRAEDPIQFIFYYKDTRDMDYLENVLEGIDKEYISEIDNLLDFEI